MNVNNSWETFNAAQQRAVSANQKALAESTCGIVAMSGEELVGLRPEVITSAKLYIPHYYHSTEVQLPMWWEFVQDGITLTVDADVLGENTIRPLLNVEIEYARYGGG